MDLKKIREETDILDKELIEIISKRFKLSKKAAEFKIKNHLPVEDKKREEEIIKDRYNKLKSNGFDDLDFTSSLFNLIMKKSKDIQNKRISEE